MLVFSRRTRAIRIAFCARPWPLSRQKENSMSKKLGIGDTFPNLTISLVTGGTIDLPGGMGPQYGVILFYRGHW